MRAELTELFIASRHTRLHLASSSSSSSRSPRGGGGGEGTGQAMGQGRPQGPRGKERRAGESLESKEGRGAVQRRYEKLGGDGHGVQGGEERRAGG